MDNDINSYIANARQHGLSDEQIKLSLVNAGWPESEVAKLLNPLSAPPPPTPANMVGSHPVIQDQFHKNTWIVFQYILLFISLAVTSIALAGILHYVVDENLGIKSYFSYFNEGLLLGYVSSLIVAFPTFATLFVVLRRKVELDPEVRNIKARKLFIYVALLWTFIVLLVRLVSTIYSFLSGGQNSLASLAHLAITILISGSIFVYFVLDVRREH